MELTGVVYAEVHDHATAPTPPCPSGCVVASGLTRGECAIGRSSLSVKYVLEGEERYALDGRVHVVRSGEMLVVDTGAPGRAILPLRSRTRGLCIYLPVDRTDLRLAVEAAHLDGHAMVLPAIATRLGGRLDRAARHLTLRPQDGPRLSAPLVAATARGLLPLLTERSAAFDRLSAMKPGTRSHILDKLDAARAYLHAHVDRPVRLGEVAAVAGMSPFHFARCFAEAYGHPPALYHRNIRLDAAAQTLCRTRRTVSEAAGALGFQDIGSFTRAFKRHFGVTPGCFAGRHET